MKIKFSHNYNKLNGEKKATLIKVVEIELSEQSRTFIDYDTEGIYKLPEKGKFLLLLFKGKKGTIFTTLRRFTQSKHKYYKELTWKDFDLEIG